MDSGQSLWGLPPHLFLSPLLHQPWENQARARNLGTHCAGAGVSNLGGFLSLLGQCGHAESHEDSLVPRQLETNSPPGMLTQSASFQWNLKSWPPSCSQACSKCPKLPGLSSLLLALRHSPEWTGWPPPVQPPNMSSLDSLLARSSSRPKSSFRREPPQSPQLCTCVWAPQGLRFEPICYQPRTPCWPGFPHSDGIPSPTCQ